MDAMLSSLWFLALTLTVRGQCPADRVVQGFQCGARREPCPTGSSCMQGQRSGVGECCWDDSGPVEAPCTDMLMNNDQFVTCTVGQGQGQGNGCPGNCHRCVALPTTGIGLCCPVVSRPGCENSAPTDQLFARSAREMQALGNQASAQQTTSGSGWQDGRQMDTRMTQQFPSVPEMPQRRVEAGQCPGGFPPVAYCQQFGCPGGTQCYRTSLTSGVCCRVQVSGMSRRQTGFSQDSRFRPDFGGTSAARSSRGGSCPSTCIRQGRDECYVDEHCPQPLRCCQPYPVCTRRCM